MGRLFGTDGVRGVANTHPMTPQFVLRLGMVGGRILRSLAPQARPALVVGRDTRQSGEMLEAALVAGLTAVGLDVLTAGILPTPAVSFLTRRHRVVGGAVISASHNPFEDNGVKFFSSEGGKLPDGTEDEIEKALTELTDDRLHEIQNAYTHNRLGRVISLTSGLEEYVSQLVSDFGPRHLEGRIAVVDCANGASYRSSPMVLERLGARVEAIHVSPDGKNINRGGGSLNPEVLRQAVLECRADFGISHDGDADRVILVDERGEFLDGDAILGLLARDLSARGELPKRAIVATVMSNHGLTQALKPLGIEVLRAPVGDRYVREWMDRDGLVLGGEQSGHVILSRLAPTGDGLLTALEVLKVMVRSGKKLSELHAFVSHFPQILLNVRVREKLDLNTIPGLTDMVRMVEGQLQGAGRVYLRYSGTEPLARVMVEGPVKEQVEEYARAIARVIEAQIGLRGVDRTGTPSGIV